MGKFKKFQDGKLYVDFTGVDAENPRKAGIRKEHDKFLSRMDALKAIFPYKNIMGNRRKFYNVEELNECINKYFNSCMGPLTDKYGNVLNDANGDPIMVFVKPLTLSGLANALGMHTDTLRNYHWKSLAGVVNPEFSCVILNARQRIQEYTETRLFDRDGSGGAQFVMTNGFSWSTKRDAMEIAKNAATIQKMQEEIKLRRKEFELKRKLIYDGTGEDSNITINITRATKE